MGMETIKGKNILVAGATGGIGRQLVKQLSASGARLFLTGRNEEALRQIAAENNIPERCLFAADLTHSKNVTSLGEAYFSEYQTIDILINASGIGIIKPMETLSDDDFIKTLMINLYAPFLLLKTFLPSIDLLALETGNGIMALLSLVTYGLVKKQMEGRPEAFVRGVYSSSFLKLMVCMISILVYVLLNRSHIHKPSVFMLFGIYAVYTIMETWLLSKLVRG